MKALAQVDLIKDFGNLTSTTFGDVIGKEIKFESDSLKFTNSIKCPYSFTLHMGLNSEEWKSLLVFNFEEPFLHDLVDCEDTNLGMDALGEVLNTLGGYLASLDDVKANYGELVQAPPMAFYTPVIFPTAESLYGELSYNGHKIFFAFLIQPMISELMKKILARKRQSLQ